MAKTRKTLAISAVAGILLMCLSAAAAAERQLVPMGCTVGVSLKTEGVMVVDVSYEKLQGQEMPAAQAGVLPGDIIVAVGDRSISCGEDFKAAVSELTGSEIELEIMRNGIRLQLVLKPVMQEGAAKLGLWLRDGISGIGTLTFYDPQTGVYGGLGHGVNDTQSGLLIYPAGGEINRSSVEQIKRGLPGEPGELGGQVVPEQVWGDIRMNTTSGIFGILSADCPHTNKAIPVAKENEIELGRAVILANVRDAQVEEFEVQVLKLYPENENGRSLMLQVTDETLLELTGGIVQGMSGSPIIQNGKLIGAVTHVMINDPTKGFGISAEDMLKTADSGDWKQTADKAA